MKTYEQILDNIRWWYFYDRTLRLWTVFIVDENDYQVGEANYYNDKKQMLEQHKFNFKNVLV